MQKKNPLTLIVGVLCIVLLVVAAMVAVLLDSQSPDPLFGLGETETTTQPTATEPVSGGTTDPGQNVTEPPVTEPPVTEPPVTEPPVTKPPVTEPPVTEPPVTEPPVTAPPVTEPPVTEPPVTEPPVTEPPVDPSKTPIAFPYKIPEYGLTIERIAPYSGMFVEDGTNATVENVAMLLVRNQGDFPVEYAQIYIEYGQQILTFEISALPVGQSMVVQEKTAKKLPAGDAYSATATVVLRASMGMSENQVRIIDNGDNTLTIQNLTNETIPTIRIFYKYYMYDEGVYVGGIAFTVRVSRLGAGASVTVQPSHYTSQTSRVVMVLTYDSEV